MKVSIISLGCARNLVDTELVTGRLKVMGFDIADEVEGSDVVLINTCAFIEESKKESIETILKAVKLKDEGGVKNIIVCGCLGQRYGRQVSSDIAEVDAILGVDSFKTVARAIKAIGKGRRYLEINSPDLRYPNNIPRVLITPVHYAYIKIAEGCHNHCSYCAICNIRGSIRSRPMGSILSEIGCLASRKTIGEFNIIAQDSTSYGIDRYKRPALVKLLKKICGLNKAHWIRLLYAHPGRFSDDLIDTIATQPNICKYIDLPIQHISDKILSAMNRGTSRRQIETLIKKIRRRIPSAAIRTSVITGFPSETEADFRQLLDFIKDTQFERLGAFVYSREEGTPAFGFKGHIRERVKARRFDRVMRLQQAVSESVNRRFLGRRIEVLVEKKLDNDTYEGRSEYDAPEVDGAVYVRSKALLAPGQFVQVDITDTLEYDLTGNAVCPKKIKIDTR
ncbi:MAG: 30S ribosomal protein S12 methylthiotransferase RimO [Candidatus Omnitrophota bacterium]